MSRRDRFARRVSPVVVAVAVVVSLFVSPGRAGADVAYDSGLKLFSADYCMAATSSGSGAQVTIAPCNNGLIQGWAYVGYSFQLASGMCLDVPGANFSPGQPLQTSPCNGTTAQLWYHGYGTSGLYWFSAGPPYLCITVIPAYFWGYLGLDQCFNGFPERQQWYLLPGQA